MKRFKYSIGLLTLFMLTLGQSCTNLDEELFDQASLEDYVANDKDGQAIASILGDAYGKLLPFMNHGNVFSIQELATDEALIPTRGADWYDGGDYLRLHRHEDGPGVGVHDGAWTRIYGGISSCNSALAILGPETETNSSGIAEVKALRALYYYFLIDIFGNVPLIDTFDVPDDFKPKNNTRKEVFDFIVADLTNAIPKLDNNVGKSRMSSGAAWALLCRMYLNAEVYTGTPMWDECIEAANKVEELGYMLAGDYFSVFSANNGGNVEHVFVIPYDRVNAKGFNLTHMTLHYESQKTFNLTDQPWNGYATTAEFFNSFDQENDIRFTGGSRGYGVVLHGPQFESDGVTPLKDAGADDDDPEINFNPVLNMLEPNAHREAGARLSKFEFEDGATGDMNNDMPLLRMGEVILNKAEAIWRRNGKPAGDAEALALVNMIRGRSNVEAFDQLTEENFLAERGREFCFEMLRRSDQIRFGTWGDAWWEKNPSAPHKTLFPIPLNQMNANENLTQNDGY